MGNKQRRATTPPKPQSAARPKWLLPTAFAVAALAVVALVVWLVQGQQATVTSGPAVTGKPTVAGKPAATGMPAVTGQPRAAIDQTKFDYGDVKLGSTIQTVFKVKNVGDKELAFQGEPQVEVLEGCWPPRAVVGSTTLKPGEETDVKLQFMMHEGMAGQHDFRVHVLTNDPQQLEQEVVIRSNWVP